jgi:hypothetical protein
MNKIFRGRSSDLGRMGIESIKVKKNVTSITSAEGNIIRCEELAESTNVTTEVAGDRIKTK